MKKAISIFTVLIIAVAAFGNGVSFNSPGTRALSMGGAYISHVNDYSAPYWNPAGLQNSEGMQATFFLTDLVPMASYKYTMPASAGGAVIDAEANANHNFAPNFAFLWTCMMSDKLRMGFSFIVPAGLSVEWEGDDLIGFNGPAVLGLDANNNPIMNQFQSPFDWEASLKVWNLSFSTAYRFGEKLNVGAALHLVNGAMTMKRGQSVVSNAYPGVAPDEGLLDTQYEEESDGWGFGLGLGAQYMLNEKLTLGLALRTPMTIGLSGKASLGTAFVDDDFDRDLTTPLWVGGGASYKVNEKLLVSAEAQWSQWSESEDYLESDRTLMPDDSLTLLWEDAVQIRFGAEYWLKENIALRGGFYIDPAPGPANTQTIMIPQADYNVIAGGIGYKFNDKLSFDAALEYLIGTDVEVSAADKAEHGVAMEGTHGINIFVWSLAATYMFK